MLALSRVFLHEPEFVSLVEGQSSPTEIEHFYYLTTAQEKEKNLARILEYEDPESAIVFCNTKDDVRYVTAFLQRRGFDADQISGDLAQAARERAMARIKAGELRFLVATDVAARGIDISDLSHVIGYVVARLAGDLRAPHRPHRARGQGGRRDLAGVGPRHRKLPLPAEGEQASTIKERTLPTDERARRARLRERLAVKVEQEIRHLSPSDRVLRVDRFLPAVEALMASDEGRRDLAAICGSYLREHRPETAVRESEVDSDPAANTPPSARPPDGRRRRRSGRGGGRGGRR